MRPFCRALLLSLLGASPAPVWAGVLVDAGTPDAGACAIRIEVTPGDVGSSATNVFSTLPSADPALFGLTGADVRKVSFDQTPGGGPLAANQELTSEFASLGVEMNSIRIDTDVYEGPASPPNATEDNDPEIFTFTVPVVAVGIINTSP